jgi:phosphoribosylformimino-5-aminoimidazole carboxamide ribotide isomerase
MLGPGNEEAAKAALRAYPGGLQVGGGITPANVGELSAAGCQGVAVSSVVCAARDPASVVRALVAGLGAAPSGAAAPPLSAGRA